MLPRPTCRRIYILRYRNVRYHGMRKGTLVFRMKFLTNLVSIRRHLIWCIHHDHCISLSKFSMHNLLQSTFDLEMLVSSRQNIRSAQ